MVKVSKSPGNETDISGGAQDDNATRKVEPAEAEAERSLSEGRRALVARMQIDFDGPLFGKETNGVIAGD